MAYDVLIHIHDLAQSQLFAAGLFGGTALTLALSRRLGVWWPHAIVGIVVALIGAVLGGRAMWLLLSADPAPEMWWNPITSGYSSLGALGGAVMLVAIFWRSLDYPCARLADLYVPGGLLALAMARLGCLWRGCDFGRPSSVGVRYPAESMPWQFHVERGLATAEATSPTLHALPVYLSAAALAGGIVAIVMILRGKPGAGILGAILYFFLRAIFEVFRETGGRFPVNLVLSSVLVAVAVVGFRYCIRSVAPE